MAPQQGDTPAIHLLRGQADARDSIHAGQVTVADGTQRAAEKLARVLTNDSGMGVIHHVDAGYDRAVEVAAERDVCVPMRD